MTENKELLTALAAAISDMRDPVKNAKNPHFKSNYADLNSVLECIREPLEKHGLLVLQIPNRHTDGVRVIATSVYHPETGDEMELGDIELVMDKQTAQAQGSAITYARRYALQTIFGLSAVDDDGNEASAPRERAKPAPKKKSKAPPYENKDEALNAIYLVKTIEGLNSVSLKIVESKTILSDEAFQEIVQAGREKRADLEERAAIATGD